APLHEPDGRLCRLGIVRDKSIGGSQRIGHEVLPSPCYRGAPVHGPEPYGDSCVVESRITKGKARAWLAVATASSSATRTGRAGACGRGSPCAAPACRSTKSTCGCGSPAPRRKS